MAENLFPVFEMPVVTPMKKTLPIRYLPSLEFDFALGDFVRDGANKLVSCDGHKAWQQWCLKAVLTERFACLAYGPDIGTETEDQAERTRAAKELALERTITEALLVDQRTEYVRGFVFDWQSDALYISFTVKGRAWEAETLSLKTKIGG